MDLKYFLIAMILSFTLASLPEAERATAFGQTPSEEVEIQATGGPALVNKYLKLLSGGDEVRTSSRTFVDIPGMTASINAGKGACITAALSMETALPNFDALFLRALLDSQLMEGHSSVGAVVHTSAGDGRFELVSYTFWKCGVSAGTHTVTIEWQTIAGGELVARGRTLIIEGR
jgi:hypothetical protein